MRYENAFALVGNTPHLQVHRSGHSAASFWVKLKGYNPTGSIKDRAGVQLVQDSLKSGRLQPGMTLLDASSGNMGCAIAYFGRLAGYPAKIYSSSKLTEDKRGTRES